MVRAASRYDRCHVGVEDGDSPSAGIGVEVSHDGGRKECPDTRSNSDW